MKNFILLRTLGVAALSVLAAGANVDIQTRFMNDTAQHGTCISLKLSFASEGTSVLRDLGCVAGQGEIKPFWVDPATTILVYRADDSNKSVTMGYRAPNPDGSGGKVSGSGYSIDQDATGNLTCANLDHNADTHTSGYC